MSPQEGSVTDAALRARSFGAVAQAYDRIRPGYPPALVDDLLGFAGPVERVLEVGAGTGRATAALAGRGLRVHAIEPDPAMAALITSRGLPSVSVTVGGFEQQPADGWYDLLVCAQAWHWVDPHVRWSRAASCLRPGGTLALFWNHDRPLDRSLAVQLQAAHDRWTPGIQVDDKSPAEDPLLQWPGPQLARLAEFTDLEARRYRWERVLSGPEYVELLSTVSAYNVRSAQARAALFDEVLAIVGAQIVLAMDTVLYLARRAAWPGA